MGINICYLLPPPVHPLFGQERSSLNILKKRKKGEVFKLFSFELGALGGK